jgi:protein O-GlcNAc transferase
LKDTAEGHYQRGATLHNAGDFTGALAAYDTALAAAPRVAAVHCARGNALAMLRMLDQAVTAYDSCLALDPGNVMALYNRATAFVQMQRWDDALTALGDIVARYPAIADAWNNRAGVLQALGRYEEALDSLEQVVRLRPRDARAFYNAGIMLLTLRRFGEAQQVLARTLELEPGNGDAMGCMASAALRACDWKVLEAILPRILQGVRDGSVIVPPQTLLALTDDPDLQLTCAQVATKRNLAETELAGPEPTALVKAAYAHDRIRVGYMSSDFRDHPVAAQIVGLLEGHDRSRFEVIGFSTGRPDGSAGHHRVVEACDRFHDISAIGSREAAQRIRQAEVDILLDLNGHTLGWRPVILKYRPAPVIATYLGYAGTTGAAFVDYIIGDPYVTPFSLGSTMSEQIVQLPHCFWPSDPALAAPQAVSRGQAGLPEDAFVFCCFNAHYKIRLQTFEIWARLLNAVAGSILWLRAGDAAMDAHFRREAAIRGVDPQRLIFAAREESLARHLGRLGLADLFLDTFPYTAHATASDALWAGVPIVTLQGRSFVSRVSSSLLANAGLGDLIASSMEEYESIALSLARDPARLATLRRRLAETRGRLFDMPGLVAGIEGAYAQMHARAQSGAPPSAFRVEGTAYCAALSASDG